MRNAVRTLLFTSVLTSQPVLAQSSNQSTNEISLTCRVQVVNKNVSNYGQIYETFYRIRFNPPQIINQDGTTMSALINDNEIRWVHGYTNGLSEAKDSRDIIVKIMTVADVSKAQELARECVKKQYKGC